MMGVMLLGVSVFAQQPAAPQAYDLQAVIQRTLAANPDIAASRQAVETAKTKVSQAEAEKRAQVTANAGYTLFDKDPSFTVGGFGTLVFGKTSNPYANINAMLPIYTGRMVENMIKASRYGVDAALQGYARQRQERAAEAAVAYYQALSAGQMVEVMQAQVATLENAVKVSTALNQQGIVAKVDVLRPTAELESAHAMLTQAENGRQLALTFKEFELLRFLASHPGRVHTREALLNQVWGYEYFGGLRTVDVHVRRIRAKLGAKHENLVQTVHGVGYKFVT
jgi:outer membrane protein TolC